VCMVSMVIDYARQRVEPNIWIQQPQTYFDFKRLLEKIEELDRKLGEPECRDPAKAAWMREIEERLAKLEKRHKGQK